MADWLERVSDESAVADLVAAGKPPILAKLLANRGVSAADVEKFLVAKLHFNATVVKVHVLDSIPLNANGKTDYPKLKGMCGK